MPILNNIQRRSMGGRLLLAAIYAVLGIGAVTMIYPFLLMLSGSTKSELDMRQLDIFPRFLYDETALFQRFEEQRYTRLDAFNIATLYHDNTTERLYSFSHLRPPAAISQPALDAWEAFLATKQYSPSSEFAMGHFAASRTVAELQLRFQRELSRRFPQLPRVEISNVTPIEDWALRTYQPLEGPFGEVYRDLRDHAHPRYFYPISLRGYFITYTLALLYSPNADGLRQLNENWGTHYQAFADIELPATPPTGGPQRQAWWTFVRNFVSGRFVRIDPSLHEAYRSFLQTKYHSLEKFNALYQCNASSWSDIPVPVPGPGQSGTAVADVENFVATLSDPAGLRLASVDFEWTEHLRARFQSGISELNAAWGTRYPSFEAIPMPVLAHDYVLMKRHKGEILWEFLTRNYRVAWNEVVLNGSGLRNTFIFCALNILTALIVNPLAAYGLSRFQPRWGQKALFVMMATMAFPAEVTQIPSFLLLRDLGWLNTFAALVIPAAANGYSIFLLKGFFDSLPQELYEAASIDGCGEIRAFFQITMPLSLPILAVVALAAFAAAYGSFMFAVLVCQKESMWTLMVNIYQLQQIYAQPIVFAALIIAAIPTFLVFTFCQNLIIRGIVVPVEK